MAVKMSCPECNDIVNLSDITNFNFLTNRVKCPKGHRFDQDKILKLSMTGKE